jgi:hypothetical protein
MGQGLFIVAVTRSYSETPHSVELLWTSYQPDNTHNTHNRQTSLPLLRFETAMLAIKRLLSNASDRAVLGPAVVPLLEGNTFLMREFQFNSCFIHPAYLKTLSRMVVFNGPSLWLLTQCNVVMQQEMWKPFVPSRSEHNSISKALCASIPRS